MSVTRSVTKIPFRTTPDGARVVPDWVVSVVSDVISDYAKDGVAHLGCGSGELLECVGKICPTALRLAWGVESNPVLAAEARAQTELPIISGDPLTAAVPDVGLVIATPNDSLEQYFRRAIEIVKGTGGTAAVLGKLSFLESGRRASFHSEFKFDMRVLSERVSFCVALTCRSNVCGFQSYFRHGERRPPKCPWCGSSLRLTLTDNSAMAWFLYGPARGGRFCVVPRR